MTKQAIHWAFCAHGAALHSAREAGPDLPARGQLAAADRVVRPVLLSAILPLAAPMASRHPDDDDTTVLPYFVVRDGWQLAGGHRHSRRPWVSALDALLVGCAIKFLDGGWFRSLGLGLSSS